MNLTGFVAFVTVKTDKSKKAEKVFFTQELGLHMKDEINGMVYENYAKIQFNGDRCEALDKVNVGDKVDVEYSIKGTIQTKENAVATPKNPKANDIYTNLNGLKVTVLEALGVAPTTDGSTSANTTTETKKIPKPKGAAPDGKVWDETKGEWVDELPF